jgi:membrane protein implicated in regulation of membrane protease activity
VGAGLAAAALGTDGGGSIRIPAACCGLVGLKPQRDRLPLAPADGHWLGLTQLGPIARTVEDAALLADVLGATGLSTAVRTDPAQLRIAISLRPALPCRLDPEMRAAAERAAARLRELGHATIERDPDYGDVRPLFVPRYVRGAYEDAQRLGGPDGLEPRARSLVRLGACTAAACGRCCRARRGWPTRRRGTSRASPRGPCRPARTRAAYRSVCSSSRGLATKPRSSLWQAKWSVRPRGSIRCRKSWAEMTALIVALVVLGASLLIAEAHVASFGVLGIAGIAALAVAAALAIEAAGGSPLVAAVLVVPVAAVVCGLVVVAAGKTLAIRRRRPQTGAEALIGRVGVMRYGQVVVAGERWRARRSWPDDPALAEGDQVVVEQVQGLTLSVRRAEEWEVL